MRESSSSPNALIPVGAAMSRASRYAITSLLLVTLLKLFPAGAGSLSLSAAPAPIPAARGASSGSSTWRQPVPAGMALLDRLLRRPGSNFAAAAGSPSSFALFFDGKDDRVTFGSAPNLNAKNFTVELWFMRQGPGIATSTGTGGLTAIPLVTKGMADADASNKD